MSNYNQSTRARVADINQGMRIVKAASSLAATTDVELFTVGGGKVVLLGLIGESDGIFEAAATTILVKCVVGGTDTDLSIACTTLSGLAADTMLTLPATAAGALVISTGEGAAILNAAPEWIVQPGTIQMTVAAATNTQTVTWTLWYVPMEDGAFVEAA
jgi:hypothetical protein